MASLALGPYCAYSVNVAPFFTAMMATAPPMSDSTKYGSFSTNSRRQPSRARRRSGYTSRMSSATGSGTACALHRSAAREGRDGREAPAPPSAGIERDEVRQHREEEEEATEHIPALGDPRDGLGAERMDAEDERGEARAPQQWGAARETAGDEKPASHEIEDNGVHRVNEHVAQVVAPRIHSTERVVEAERHPGERDVVPHQGLRPHPPELGPAQPPETLIAEEVDVVIPVEELAVERGQEADEHSGEDDHRENALQEPHTADTALATAAESRNGHLSPPRQVQHNANGHHAESTEAHAEPRWPASDRVRRPTSAAPQPHGAPDERASWPGQTDQTMLVQR